MNLSFMILILFTYIRLCCNFIVGVEYDFLFSLNDLLQKGFQVKLESQLQSDWTGEGGASALKLNLKMAAVFTDTEKKETKNWGSRTVVKEGLRLLCQFINFNLHQGFLLKGLKVLFEKYILICQCF